MSFQLYLIIIKSFIIYNNIKLRIWYSLLLQFYMTGVSPTYSNFLYHCPLSNDSYYLPQRAGCEKVSAKWLDQVWLCISSRSCYYVKLHHPLPCAEINLTLQRSLNSQIDTCSKWTLYPQRKILYCTDLQGPPSLSKNHVTHTWWFRFKGFVPIY